MCEVREERTEPLDGAQHLEAIHPRHLQVEDDAVHRVTRQALECGPAARRDERFVTAQTLQVIRVLLRHGRDVVDDERDGHVSIGISTMNVDPWPGSVSTLRAPLESSTRRRTINRPSPVPPGLVV